MLASEITLLTAPSPPVPGQVIAGKYRVDSILGSGGVGVVVAATHLQLHAPVAIKFLRPEAGADKASIARLLREARATAQIRSTHVPRVSDVGVLESGSPYVVMELLQGEDLSAVLGRVGRLSVGDAASYVLDSCEAVHRAHELGILHRDLKPSNIFIALEVDGQRSVKVLDFGLSTIGDGTWARSLASRLTAPNAVLGTPRYMSPEQMESAALADARSDVWSLGAILYEALAGRPPFDANSLPQLCTLIMHGQPVPLFETRDDLPIRLGEIVTRCLQKDPANRYQTARALAEALADLGVGPRPGWLAQPPEIAAATQSSRGPAIGDPTAAASRTRRPRWMPLALAALAIVGAGLGVSRRIAGRHAATSTERPSTINGPAATCSACVSKRCDAEFRSCQNDPECARSLATYNDCVRRTSPDHAAGCSEELGTSRNTDAQRLAGCVFVRTEGEAVVAGSCAEACNGLAIDDPACVGYCSCMKQTCPSVMDAASCLSACASLKGDVTHCRSYHCFLASQGDPQLHCQHAIGHLGVCESTGGAQRELDHQVTTPIR